MEERIRDKINEIAGYLDELSEIVPSDYDSYSENPRDRAACERFFEKIVEACVDLGFIIIKYKRLEVPTGDKEVFKILQKHKIIPSDLADRLSEAKGMRNILAHEYGKVNDQLVYDAVHDELLGDVKLFLSNVEKVIVKVDL
jgi:uncharacterized protein YutE (UPF0331/DUF86 family)